MQATDSLFNLEQKRIQAGITQSQMAELLSISQPQVSRYEQDPESVPGGILKKWHSICGQMSGGKGMEMDDPMLEKNARMSLMRSYAELEPTRPAAVTTTPPLTAAQFLRGVEYVGKKPKVAVVGQFDAGKSRLINTLFGGDRLPTGYQPNTSAVCLMRHRNEKPTWQPEDVWIYGKGFDLDRADDEAHCLKHKMFAGSFDSLAQYGTHTGEGREHQAFAATVYIDAPLLLAADIVDLPGYGNSDEDKNRAELAHKTADVVIYTSLATGFMPQHDLAIAGILLRSLPVFENSTARVEPLRNFMVVATQAHHVGGQAEIDRILDQAAKRGYKHLENAIGDRRDQSHAEINEADYRARHFAFSADDATLRNAFETELKELLSNVMPAATLSNLNRHILMAKASATGSCDNWVAGLQVALDERSKAQEEVKEIEKNEPERIRKNASRQQSILGLINQFGNESAQLVIETFREKTTVASIENMIKVRYGDDKKEAQKLAPSYQTDAIQKIVNDGIRVKSNELGAQVEVFLESYGPDIDKDSLLSNSWDFNPRAAFMGALSGLGAIGALTAWAAIAAAGSNLGAYILIGQIVGWLSSIGISLGGSGTVMALVSAIGGPITLGIIAALAVAIAVFSFAGDSWETKLAKKIRDGLIAQKAERQVADGVEKFWQDTKSAFEEAVKLTEQAYQEKLKSLRTLAFSTDRASIEAELAFAKETRNFFGGMPWKPLTS